MKAIPFDVGRVAVSKQGHDKGDWFVVMAQADERHVLIADGLHRKMEKPKKKQTKHLKAKPHLAENIAAAISEGKPLLDSDLRKALQAAKDALQFHPGSPAPQLLKEECALVKE